MLNNKDTLEQCIESVISQTYPYKELIIIDGGSVDGTIEILKDKNNKIAYWESKPDQGIYHAWNKALDHANGEWLCFVGADDYFINWNVLKNITPHLNKATNSGIKLVYGQIVRTDVTGKTIRILGKPWNEISWQIRHGMPLHLPHPGMMHHRSLFQKYGRFDQTFKIGGDYEFLLRELKDRNKKALYTGFQTMGSQIGGIADTNQFITLSETRNARIKNGLPGLSLLWIAVYFRACIRKILKRISYSLPPYTQ